MALGALLVLMGPASKHALQYRYRACPGPQHWYWLSNGPMPAIAPDWSNATRPPGSASEAKQQSVELSQGCMHGLMDDAILASQTRFQDAQTLSRANWSYRAD